MPAELRDVDRAPVAWREAGSGSGDVVVFLHGLGGTRTAWDPQLTTLGDRWRCVAWDQPGYGASAPVDGEMTFAALASSLVGLLDTLDVEQAPLVGLSFGGMVALHVAIRYPERVRALALLDTSPAFGFDGVTDAEAWMARRIDPLDRGVTPAQMAPAVLRSVAGPQAPDAVIGDASASMARISSAGLRAAVRCLPTHDVRYQLSTISCPTLVACGELDTETPPAYGRYLAEEIPGARFELIAGAGHLSNLEAPEAVNGLLERFLGEVAAF